MKTDYDIVIVGGGLIGLCLAHALTYYLPYRIALIESQTVHTIPDQRSIALAYGSALFLQQINVWHKLVMQSTAIQYIHISEQQAFGLTCLSAQAAKVPALGYVVLQRDLLQALTVKMTDKLTLLQPVKLTHMQRNKNLWKLNLDNGQAVHAPLIVAADGSQSTVRSLQGIANYTKDYAQSAVIADLKVQHPQSNTAFERFTHKGPLALLPLRTDEYSLIWCLPKPIATEIANANDQAFIQQVQTYFGYRLGRVLQTSKRNLYPLKQSFVSEQIRLGMVLIGNAAHTLHPIAGQGFNLGLRDVIALTQQLLKAKQKGLSLSDFSILQAYQKNRIRDQQRLLHITDGLLNCFKIDNGLLRQARGLSLLTLDQCPGLQSPVYKTTLGLTSFLRECHG